VRLLVINFEMDRLSRSMPWSPAVVDRLARSCELVVVMTSRIGAYDPPPNVRVELIQARPLGIPSTVGSWWVNVQALRLLLRCRFDACFIHMAMGWAYRLSPCFRLLGLPTLVWYAHGTVTDELHKAHRHATRIVTSTPEGFRIPSEKVRVIGQGVDTDLFQLQPLAPMRNEIIAVSRISPRKRIELLLDVMEELRRRPGTEGLRLRLVGTTITAEDQYYDLRLRERMWLRGLQEAVDFVGFVPQAFLPACYQRAFVHLNVSGTGSMDKTVLEALACGCPALTSNEAFRELLAGYPEFLLHDPRPVAIADAVLDLHRRRDAYDRTALRRLVVGRHDLDGYVEKVRVNLEELSRRRGNG